jgi:hypothetical protein
MTILLDAPHLLFIVLHAGLVVTQEQRLTAHLLTLA